MSTQPEAVATVHVDGGFRPSSKLAACAAVAMIDRRVTAERRVETLWLGKGHTNNTAEYEGLLLGMKLALRFEVFNVQMVCDSKLVVEQVLGSWAINDDRLRNYVAEAQELSNRFSHIEIFHVKRFQNKDADKLVTELLDQRSGKRR